MQGRIKRALLDLENFVGNLLNAFGNRPAVFWLERDRLQNQEVERALDKVAWFSHTLTIYNSIVDSQQ